jgi:hypothetical protein
MMINFPLLLQGLAVGILYSLAGCATYQTPTGYRYFPEYGWLPVIENAYTRNEVYKSEILIDYVAYDWHAGKDGSIDTKTARGKLPATEAEAKSIAEGNLSLARNARNKETAKMIVAAPVLVPATVVMWTPPFAWIIGYGEHEHAKSIRGEPRASVEKDGKPEIRREAADTAPSGEAAAPVHGSVDVRVADRVGRPVADAEVVLVYSPIWFAAYADEGLHRSYPGQRLPYEYRVSSEFAGVLAHYLGMEGAPHGENTDASGSTSIALGSGIMGVMAFSEASGLVHILVNKPGYAPQAMSIPAAKFASTHTFTVTLDEERQSPSTIKRKLNPWTVSRDLEKQVEYYVRKYDNDPTWIRKSRSDAAWKVWPDSPPLAFERFEEYALAAYDFAPDYPVVQSAMFFYELEKGDRQAAKKYGRFIDNNIYAKAIYHMVWMTGLPLR